MADNIVLIWLSLVTNHSVERWGFALPRSCCKLPRRKEDHGFGLFRVCLWHIKLGFGLGGE